MKKILGVLVAVSSLSPITVLYSQELGPEEVEFMLYKSQTEPKFQAFMSDQFADFGDIKLDYRGLSSVVAIPIAQAGQFSLNELREGQIIGALYLSSGSSRLQLPPGRYAVKIQGGEEEGWQVEFFDEDNVIWGSTGARVIGTEQSVERPISAADHSVCYRADAWEVCF